MSSTHSQRLERWLGKEDVERISRRMRGWYGPPIALAGVPGNVFATGDGDFIGNVRDGWEATWMDYARDWQRRLARGLRVASRRNQSRANLGVSSLSDIIEAATAAGGKREMLFYKTGPANSGLSQSLYRMGHLPQAGVAPGAAPGGTVLTKASPGGMRFTNTLAGETQHIASATSTSSFAGSSLLLMDVLWGCSKTMASTANEAVTGAPTRYQGIIPGAADSAEGNFLFVQVGATPLAATAHNWDNCTYIDQDGVASTLPTLIGSTGAAADRIDDQANSWFAPLATGDRGIKSLTNMHCSASVATGDIWFFIAHPLAIITHPIANLMCQYDGINNTFNLVRVFNDACLTFLEISRGTGSAVNYSGKIVTVAGAWDGIDRVQNVVWKSVLTGGGGLVTGLDMHADGTKVIRTDAGGAYLKEERWTQLQTQLRMPVPTYAAAPGYRQFDGCTEIKVAASNTNHIYLFYPKPIGAPLDGNQIIYSSIDKGLTFLPTAYPANEMSGIDGSGIILRSNNQTHRQIENKFAIDPVNDNIVYSTNPGLNPTKTEDGGATWSLVTDLPVGVDIGACCWVFDPSGGTTGGKTNIIYVVIRGSGVWQSIDAGVSWALISDTVGNAFHHSHTNACVDTAGTLYVSWRSAASGTTYTVSRWMASTWTTIQTANSGIRVAAHPVTAGVICTMLTIENTFKYSSNSGTSFTSYTMAQQTFTSADAPWQAAAIAAGFSGLSCSTLKFDPANPDELWVCLGQGVWHATISAVAAPAWNTDVLGIEELITNDLTHESGTDLFHTVWDEIAFKRPTNTLDTTPADRLTGATSSLANGWAFAIDPANTQNMVVISDSLQTPSIIYSSYSNDGGATWTPFPTIPTITASHYSSVCINNGVIIWIGAGFSTGQKYPYRSTDWGVTWTPLNTIPGIPSTGDTGWTITTYYTRKTAVADYVNPNTFYLSNTQYGIYRSTDGGVTFSLRSVGGRPYAGTYNLMDMEPTPGHEGHLWATCGYNHAPDQVHPIANETFLRSTDGGANWTAVPNVLEVTHIGFGKAFVAGGYPTIYIIGFVSGDAGIFMSKDEGLTWIKLVSDKYGPWPMVNNVLHAIEGDKDIIGRVYVGGGGFGACYCDLA